MAPQKMIVYTRTIDRRTYDCINAVYLDVLQNPHAGGKAPRTPHFHNRGLRPQPPSQMFCDQLFTIIFRAPINLNISDYDFKLIVIRIGSIHKINLNSIENLVHHFDSFIFILHLLYLHKRSHFTTFNRVESWNETSKAKHWANIESPQESGKARVDCHSEYHERESDEHCGPERAKQEHKSDGDIEWATPCNPRMVVVLLYASDVHRHQVHHFSNGSALCGSRGDSQRLAVHCSDQCGAHPECGLRGYVPEVLVQ